MSHLSVINDVLDLSKIEAGKIVLDPIRLHLRQVLGDEPQLRIKAPVPSKLGRPVSVQGVKGRRLLDDPKLSPYLLPLTRPSYKRTSIACGRISASAALSAAARELHLPDRGRITPGMRADLLLVNGNPAVDIRSTRDIAAIWKAAFRVNLEAWLSRVQR